MSKHHETLTAALRTDPQDYEDWGTVVRWDDPDKQYPDCSYGCKFYYKLQKRGKENLGNDWGVCTNPKSHRCGLLTFEHQGCEHGVRK